MKLPKSAEEDLTERIRRHGLEIERLAAAVQRHLDEAEKFKQRHAEAVQRGLALEAALNALRGEKGESDGKREIG